MLLPSTAHELLRLLKNTNYAVKVDFVYRDKVTNTKLTETKRWWYIKEITQEQVFLINRVEDRLMDFFVHEIDEITFQLGHNRITATRHITEIK